MNTTELAALIITGILIIMDYGTGIAKAAHAHDIDSGKMREGLWHKSAYVLVVVLAGVIEHGQHWVDLGYTLPLVIPACVYIILTETASILENLVQINPELAQSPVLDLFRRDDGKKS
ncbi:phage holin family protein [Bifidobacterium vansinderenii]|uniref:Holin n=1 Tax=Bifidobacterium vansinderenii TaxID=1984871 RepID=A0A229VZS5_9BIFI|nr:phage holin family protein [Bifidobacterium vansinderenii]OXN01123.1 holin [Bifidobacterium vansinderenii]